MRLCFILIAGGKKWGQVKQSQADAIEIIIEVSESKDLRSAAMQD